MKKPKQKPVAIPLPVIPQAALTEVESIKLAEALADHTMERTTLRLSAMRTEMESVWMALPRECERARNLVQHFMRGLLDVMHTNEEHFTSATRAMRTTIRDAYKTEFDKQGLGGAGAE